jgi:hypothetical protein
VSAATSTEMQATRLPLQYKQKRPAEAGRFELIKLNEPASDSGRDFGALTHTCPPHVPARSVEIQLRFHLLPWHTALARITLDCASEFNQVFHVFDAFLKPAHFGGKGLEGWLLHVAHTCVPKLSRFDLWSSSRCMPEAKDEHRIWIAKQFVNDAIRSMDDFSHRFQLEFRHNPASFRKSGNGKCLINQRVAEFHCLNRIITRDEGDNLS